MYAIKIILKSIIFFNKHTFTGARGYKDEQDRGGRKFNEEGHCASGEMYLTTGDIIVLPFSTLFHGVPNNKSTR